MNIKHLLAASAAIVAISSPALAQEYNDTLGSFDGPPTVTDVGDPVITQTGDASVDPYQNTITSEQEQSVESSGSGGQFVSTTIDGFNYFGFMTVEGSGSQSQTETQTQVNQYDPNDVLAPPTVVSTDIDTSPLGDPTVDSVSVTGFVGSTPRYSSTLTSSGEPDEDGNVVAIQNSSLLNSAGITFAQRIGTATYNPTDGSVTVNLPEAPTTSVAVSGTGIALTGGAGISMGGAKITGLGAGTVSSSSTDAVNGSQLSAFQTSITGQLATFQTSVNGQITNLTSLVHRFNKRLEGGIAVATALSGATFLPDKKINITANVGAYRGETAAALQLGALVSENVAVNAGVATGFNSGAGTAFRGGLTFGF